MFNTTIEAKTISGQPMTTKDLFFQLTDEDFVMLAQEGHLESICNALSVDLHSNSNIQNEC